MIVTFDTYTLIYLLTNIFNVFVIRKLVLVFFDKRNAPPLVCNIFYSLYFFVTSFLYLFLDIPFVILLANIILIFLITFIYEASLSKRLLSTLYVLMFCVIPEVIVTACTGYFQYSIFEEGSYRDSFGVILTRLVTYVEALLLSNFKATRQNQKVGKTVWMASVLIPVSSIVLFIILLGNGQLSQVQLITGISVVYFLNITTFYLYDSLASSYKKLSETVVMEKEKELYFRQCEMMQDSTEELRAFRHDLNNQLIAVTGLLEAGKDLEAARLLSELTGKTRTYALHSTTGNVPVDSIVNYKLQNAMKEKITVESEVRVPQDLEMEVSDCITILGNLLDNAITAVTMLPEEKRFLRLKVVYDRGRLIVRCENPYCQEIVCQNGEIVSSKQNQSEHGIGLKNVERVVEKYMGCMNIYHENQTFLVEILIFLSNSYEKSVSYYNFPHR